LGYGLTTVRFYPMAFMTWLAIVFVWFALTVLRGNRNRFAWGALWSAIVIFAATNLINPHAFIAEHNLDLMRQGRSFDVEYHTAFDMSDDAVPTLLQGLPLMSPYDACVTRMRLRDRLIASVDEQDLRSWNLARSRARDDIAAERSVVEETAIYRGCVHLSDVNEELP
jgi:hypothetical protein